MEAHPRFSKAGDLPNMRSPVEMFHKFPMYTRLAHVAKVGILNMRDLDPLDSHGFRQIAKGSSITVDQSRAKSSVVWGHGPSFNSEI